MLGSEEILRLSSGLKGIAGDLWQSVEFSIEVNPDDASVEKALAWQSCGINRFSVGTQSFNPEELRRIGRRHSPQRAIEAVSLLSHYGDVSLDLIIGLPHQDMESFRYSVAQALKLNPDHISAYILELEEGSALTKLYNKGAISIPDEDLTAQMYIYLCNQLATNGYLQYEISNFAKPGHPSRHNSSYWEGTPYIGLGASASSYDGARQRRMNVADIHKYIADPNASEIEQLSDEELREEYLLTRLRRTLQGISLEDYALRFGTAERDRLMQAALPYLSQSLLIVTDNHLRFSGVEGYLREDAILATVV
jgi:oxygen-independent coproporphyrinogen-3 oxidase